MILPAMNYKKKNASVGVITGLTIALSFVNVDNAGILRLLGDSALLPYGL